MENSGVKFIWGIKSSDETEEGPVNCNSLTDFEIYYRYDTEMYYYEIEAIYRFNTHEDEIYYIKDLYKKVTLWMRKMGYKTDYIPSIYVFSIHQHGGGFESIEELYAHFKMLCIGYARINSKKHKKIGG